MTLGAAVSYVLNIVAGLVESLSWLRFFSPYHYSDAQRVLTEGAHWPNQAVLLVAALVCAALALAAFERREIGVGRSPLAALLGREQGAEGEAEAARSRTSHGRRRRARRPAGPRDSSCHRRRTSAEATRHSAIAGRNT